MKKSGSIRRENIKVQELEAEIEENLEATGLASNINLYYGNFRDSKNPPYLEFKTILDERTKKLNPNCRELRELLTNILIVNHSEICGISYDYKFHGVWRAKLILNYDARIQNKEDFKMKVLSNLSSTLAGYLARMKRKKEHKSYNN